MTRRWTGFFTAICRNPWVRGGVRALFYTAILAALILLYGRGDFSTPKFVYQGF